MKKKAGGRKNREEPARDRQPQAAQREQADRAPDDAEAAQANAPAADEYDARDDARRAGKDPARFPVVALGASAGGLSALDQFFQHVPNDSGMAFVVITHQAADRVTMLPELLSKRATIPVITAEDGQRLRPNHAYVAPPGHSLIIKDESLHLSSMEGERAGGLPIDLAFRSLAANEGDQAIAIVLSGNGSDGTLGIGEIKSAYGMVMAQDPGTAQYPGMPSSAITTQLVDFVLPPDQMPAQLLSYVRGKRRGRGGRFGLEDPASDGTLHKILTVLRARSGSDFGAYKKSTIRRRIERRMHVHNIADAEEYARFLEHTSYEVDALFKELLISVTSFFRDPQAFEALEHELAKLLELKGNDHTLRVWIAGCATGEERRTCFGELGTGVEE